MTMYFSYISKGKHVTIDKLSDAELVFQALDIIKMVMFIPGRYDDILDEVIKEIKVRGNSRDQ